MQIIAFCLAFGAAVVLDSHGKPEVCDGEIAVHPVPLLIALAQMCHCLWGKVAGSIEPAINSVLPVAFFACLSSLFEKILPKEVPTIVEPMVSRVGCLPPEVF